MSAFSPRIPFDFPRILIEDADSMEREDIEQLTREIQLLKKYTDDFCDALILFEFSRHNAQQSNQEFADFFLKWKLLAARDGAMTIHFFARAFEKATRLLCKCQSLSANVDRAKLESAVTILSSSVPEFEAVRDAVTRARECMNDSDSSERQYNSQPQRLDGAERGILNKRKYQNVFEGKLQSYQINRQTYEGLIAAAKEFCSAFGHYFKDPVSQGDLSPQRSENFVWWVRPD